MHDVITIGSATQDVFLISKQFRIIKTDLSPTGFAECVPLGSKIEVDQIVQTTGGGGTNSAATFANLGFKVAVVTRVGDDPAGREVMHDLAKHRIDTSLMRTVKNGDTGFAALLTTKEGERSVLVHRGVSADFNANDVPKKLDAKWMYMSSVAGDLAFATKVVRDAAKKQIRVAYNPGSLELKKGLRAFEPIIRSVSILNMNLEEAQMLTRIKSRDVGKICKRIAPKDATLIITDGTNGAYAYINGTLWHARTSGAKGISRTGAGDAFGSGCVAAIMKGMMPNEALQVATLNAEAVIQEHGAKFGLLKKWPSKKMMAKINVRNLS